MIVLNEHLCTKIPIWFPKYNTDSGENEAWLSKSKVHHSSPIIIIDFTKAKHLAGQRFVVRRSVAEKCRETTNGKIAVLAVPMSALEPYETPQDIQNTVDILGW